VTIVTADGSIHTANDKSNTELFWGIRGGGCNFGVVTEFVYRLHPQRPTVYAGILMFPAAMLEKLTSFIAEWWGNGKVPGDKEALMLALTRGFDRNVWFYQMSLLTPTSNKIISLPSLALLLLYFIMDQERKEGNTSNASSTLVRLSLRWLFTVRCGNWFGPSLPDPAVDMTKEMPYEQLNGFQVR